MMFIYSPFPTIEAARAASHVLVEQRLVACCNLLPGTESHYLWEGALTSAQEVILIAKTSPANLEKAKVTLAANHPYEVPAILSFEASANREFAAWVSAATR